MTALEHVAYDRAKVSSGIVHFGLGNFHRSHQAMYLDRLLTRGEAFDWGICGVGVLAGDSRMRDVLTAQNNQYTLVERFPDGSTNARTIGSICEYLYAPDNPGAVVEKLADPAIRIVSLTITEGGYNISDATGEFDLSDPGVAADLEPSATPQTVFGLITEGLRQRRDRGISPFTVMSCDNLEGNGEIAHRTIVAFAQAKDPELANWINEHVRFPNSMVDRITPVTTAADPAFVLAEYGVEDAWPVISEDFVQWVLEDRFPLGRPAFEHVGVQLVDDVKPYEKMKLRLLNAGHQAIAYLGYLSGYRYAHEAASDPLLTELLYLYFQEAASTLDAVPGIDLDDYQKTLVTRFANPYVRDTLDRLATDASDRIPKFVVPVIVSRLSFGMSSPIAAAIVAAWARYAEGTDDEGNTILINDRQLARVKSNVDRGRTDALGFVRDRDFFGDLASDETFTADYLGTLASLRTRGARQTLRQLVAVTPASA